MYKRQASCAACHGTFGNSVVNNQNVASKSTESKGANAVLAGIAATELTEKLLGFRNGSRKATVMHRHAKGLTIDEINQLAAVSYTHLDVYKRQMLRFTMVGFRIAVGRSISLYIRFSFVV